MKSWFGVGLAVGAAMAVASAASAQPVFKTRIQLASA